MKTILNVKRVGFYSFTGDNRSPESMAFPFTLKPAISNYKLTQQYGIKAPA